jgi:hypothetical protein
MRRTHARIMRALNRTPWGPRLVEWYFWRFVYRGRP